MTVLCVESGVVYADGTAAIAAEGGANRTFEVDGSAPFATQITSAQYPLGCVVRPTAGQETTGDINVGAEVATSIGGTATGINIQDLRTGPILTANAPNAFLRRLVIDAGGGTTDAVTFNDTIDAEDIQIRNCNDGFLATVSRPNSLIRKCTVVGATRFGYAQGKFNFCVDVNSSNQGYFVEAAGSSDLWEHDGSGTDTITENPVTDIFEDYAAGDLRIKATSSPGAAGAGAFINSAPPSGITVNADATTISYQSNDPSIIITGQVGINPTLTNLSYNSNDHLISLTGQKNVEVETSLLSYQAINISIGLTGEVNIPALTTNASYTSNNYNITLTPPDTISIPVNVTALPYQSLTASITLQGEDRIEAETTNYTYSAIDSIITIGLPIFFNPRNIRRPEKRSRTISVRRTTNKKKV